jgi:hypothetical protein
MTTAFAAPESGQGGDSGGTQTSGATGTGSAPSSGSAPEATASAAPPAEASTPVMVAAVVPKPPTYVGDGRHGQGSTKSGLDGTESPFSKQTQTSRRQPPLTMPILPGEHDSAEAVTPTQTPAAVATSTQTPPTPGPKDPTDSDDPEGHPAGFGWPWWGGPCPDPHDPDDPGGPGGPGLPPSNGSGSGGAHPSPPSGRPELPPAMQLPLPREVPPQLPNISVDPVLDAGAGLASAAAGLPFVPITLPVVVAPFGVGGGGPGGAGAGSRAGTPSAPRSPGAPRNNQPTPKDGQKSPPAFSASNGVPPASFRVGYGNYLRTAGVGEMMAVAVPGVTGILVLTGAGGLVGYRQARAGRAVRASGTARFVG